MSITLDATRPPWSTVLGKEVDKELAYIYDTYKIHARIESDGRVISFTPMKSNTTLLLTPDGLLDETMSLKRTFSASSYPGDCETILLCFQPTHIGRTLYHNLKPYGFRHLAATWSIKTCDWKQTLRGLAATLRDAHNNVCAYLNHKDISHPDFDGMPSSAKLMDGVPGAYAILDLMLPANEYGYSHAISLHINMVSHKFSQLAWKDRPHPHISGPGAFCLDHSYRSLMQDRLQENDLGGAMTLLHEALMVINFSDSYHTYPGLTKCHECSDYVSEEMVRTCEDCGRQFCPSCLPDRYDYCSSCIDKADCPCCQNRFWTEEGGTCSKCEEVVCPVCLSEGPVDLKSEQTGTMCVNCLLTCPNCNSHPLDAESERCDTCGQWICKNCFEFAMGKPFCPNCLPKCPVCGGALPPDHSHTCQICGEKVCCECAPTMEGDDNCCPACKEARSASSDTTEEAVPVEEATNEEGTS